MSILSPFPLTHDKDVTPDGTWRKPETAPPPIVPLTCECVECDGEGRIYRSRFGGNDPYVWSVRCDTCAGDGEIVRLCEAQRCDRHATELVTFADCVEPYCEQCAPRMRIEAVTERLAGLTSWSRAVVLHHMRAWLRLPSGSLEMHNLGLELIEDGMDEWFRLPRDEQTRIALANEP